MVGKKAHEWEIIEERLVNRRRDKRGGGVYPF